VTFRVRVAAMAPAELASAIIQGAGSTTMISVADRARVWIAAGHTDMRARDAELGPSGAGGVEALTRTPAILYVFRGRSGFVDKDPLA